MPPKEPSDSVSALVARLQHRTTIINDAVAPSTHVTPASRTQNGVDAECTPEDLGKLRAALEEREKAGSLADERLRDIQRQLDDFLFRRTEWTNKRDSLRISFNEKLIVLAGATITLSISFLAAVSAKKAIVATPLLWSSWLCLTSSIVGSIASNWFSSHMFGITERFIIEAIQHRLEYERREINRAVGSIPKEGHVRAWTESLDQLRVEPAIKDSKTNPWLDSEVSELLDEQLKQQLHRIIPSASYCLGLLLLVFFVVKNL